MIMELKDRPTILDKGGIILGAKDSDNIILGLPEE